MRRIPFAILAAFWYVLSMPGCAGLSQSEIRHRLDVVASEYDTAKEEIQRQREQGLIDDRTWNLLAALDELFTDQWSLATIELNAGENWRKTVYSLAGIVAETAWADGVDAKTSARLSLAARIAIALSKEDEKK